MHSPYTIELYSIHLLNHTFNLIVCMRLSSQTVKKKRSKDTTCFNTLNVYLKTLTLCFANKPATQAMRNYTNRRNLPVQ